MPQSDKDDSYRELFLTPLRECANYIPQLGGQTEEGVNLERFHQLYGADPLYHWVGLDSAAMFAAHKAAGGITSVYRQLGIGCERLARKVFSDTLRLDPAELLWGYDVTTDAGKIGRITLDAKIALDEIADKRRQDIFRQWLTEAGRSVEIPMRRCRRLRGAVFEIRQGYKSADSKRQNADLRSALKATQDDLLPIVMVVSSQINGTVQRRYSSSGLRILVGKTEGTTTTSTFVFFRDVVGYDLAGFFGRNQVPLRTEVQAIVASLLKA